MSKVVVVVMVLSLMMISSVLHQDRAVVATPIGETSQAWVRYSVTPKNSPIASPADAGTSCASRDPRHCTPPPAF